MENLTTQSEYVRNRVIEMILASDSPISMHDVYKEFNGIAQGIVSSVIARLVTKDKDIKRSVFSRAKYLRASDAPLPDGHVDKGHDRIVNKMTKADREELEKQKEKQAAENYAKARAEIVQRMLETRARNKAEKVMAPLIPDAPTPTPSLPVGGMQLLLNVNGQQITMSVQMAKHLHAQLNEFFGK